jgi:hypothetical protein
MIDVVERGRSLNNNAEAAGMERRPKGADSGWEWK